MALDNARINNLNFSPIDVFQYPPHVNTQVAIVFSLAAIVRATPKLRMPVIGMSSPAKEDDPVVKLLARRIQQDHIALRASCKVAYQPGPLDDENIKRFVNIVECFLQLHAHDLARAKRRISREPALTDKGKEVLRQALSDSEILEKFLGLPFGTAARKRRNNKLADLLMKVMKMDAQRKAKQEVQRQEMKQQKEAEDKDFVAFNKDLAAYHAEVESMERRKALKVEADTEMAEDIVDEVGMDKAGNYRTAEEDVADGKTEIGEWVDHEDRKVAGQ